MKSYSFYKWRIWSILACSFIMSLFHRSAVGVISNELQSSLNLNAIQLGNIASITFYTYALMQIPTGLLLDFFGYRKISYVGIFTTGLGSIIFGLASHLYIAYLGRFLVGLGTSVIFVATLQAQRIWFAEDDFTKASGMLAFIGNFGGIIATFPLAYLVHFIGWRASMLFMGVICLVISIVIFFYVKSSPKAYGYLPQGIYTTSKKVPLWKGIKHVVTLPATWKNFFILFTLVGCTTALTGVWGMNYLVNVYDLSSTKASFYIAFIVYGLVVGSLFVEKISRHFKDNLCLYPRIACSLISLCWIYILFIEGGKPPLIMLSLMFFIMGFLAMSHIVAFTDISLYCNAESNGLASSLVNSGEFIGSAFISLLIGFLLDLSFKNTLINGKHAYEATVYKQSFCVFLIISLLGIAASFIGERHLRKD